MTEKEKNEGVTNFRPQPDIVAGRWSTVIGQDLKSPVHKQMPEMNWTNIVEWDKRLKKSYRKCLAGVTHTGPIEPQIMHREVGQINGWHLTVETAVSSKFQTDTHHLFEPLYYLKCVFDCINVTINVLF